MKHPLLTAIDEALVNIPAHGVQAIAEGGVLGLVQDELGLSGARVTQYEGVNISRSLAQIENGWKVGPRSTQSSNRLANT